MAEAPWLDKADDYLLAAQLLLGEQHYESVVSRAYYAARYAAIHLFLARKVGWELKWQHDTVATKLVEQARSLLWLRAVTMNGQSSFASSWSALYKSRSAADYQLGKITARDAQRCMAFAENFVQQVREYMP